jgi:hypothetical protein
MLQGETNPKGTPLAAFDAIRSYQSWKRPATALPARPGHSGVRHAAETAALYEYTDLVNGGQGEGLTIEELCEVVRAFNVPTTLV